MRPQSLIFVTLALTLTHTHAKILRNQALISRMMSQFQKESHNPNSGDSEQTTKPNVLKLMQSMLCRHFPTIPCHLIKADESIQKLITNSLQKKHQTPPRHQMTKKYKSTTEAPVNSVIDSEELANFLQVHEPKIQNKKFANTKVTKEYSKFNKTKERGRKIGRTKLRKFYPHKTKHDRGTEEKSSGENSRNKFNVPSESVWRIDYMKHGDPSVGFAYKANDLRGKILNAPNILVNDNLVQHRKEILHPDVYIKKKFVKKNEELLDSDMDA